jgi:UDP-GlcNAc:undecaprenyl-phosphate/decaprenyl-phosphate GlcNAc-1-phosphate transferase
VTGPQLAASAAGAVAGALVSAAAIRYRMRAAAPPALVRVNVNGREVPAVLGAPIALGALAGLGAAWGTLVLEGAMVPARIFAALGCVVVLLWLAGSWDDRRGDERARGFAGHFAAARGFQLTGGIVKLVAGAAAGLAAGVIVAHGATIVEVALLVALGANTINLLDRAPGRAGKVALVVMLPLAFLGEAAWAAGSAGAMAALAVALPADLKQRAMLGDAGANPLGGVMGLGLALSLPEAWRVAVILLLLALNLASERWSFSQAIARIAVLDAFDRMGRG